MSILELFGMVCIGLVMFWFHLVSILIIWCVPIVQICYHAKSGACSFKNVGVRPFLVLFGMVWFGLVMFWFGLVSILIIWCVPIVQICYHAKSGACSFKNERVIRVSYKDFDDFLHWKSIENVYFQIRKSIENAFPLMRNPLKILLQNWKSIEIQIS